MKEGFCTSTGDNFSTPFLPPISFSRYHTMSYDRYVVSVK